MKADAGGRKQMDERKESRTVATRTRGPETQEQNIRKQRTENGEQRRTVRAVLIESMKEHVSSDAVSLNCSHDHAMYVLSHQCQ